MSRKNRKLFSWMRFTLRSRTQKIKPKFAGVFNFRICYVEVCMGASFLNLSFSIPDTDKKTRLMHVLSALGKRDSSAAFFSVLPTKRSCVKEYMRWNTEREGQNMRICCFPLVVYNVSVCRKWLWHFFAGDKLNRRLLWIFIWKRLSISSWNNLTHISAHLDYTPALWILINSHGVAISGWHLPAEALSFWLSLSYH